MNANGETLTFTFDWRMPEHARFANYLNREFYGQGIWRLLGWALLLLVGAAIVLGVIVALGGNPGPVIQLSPWIVLILLWLWFFRSGAGWVQAWQTRRQDPNVGHTFTHGLTPSGLRIQTHTAEVELKWAGMHRVRERPEGFVFYYSKRCAYHLPKRAVGTDATIAEVRQYIRAHLPDSIRFLAE